MMQLVRFSITISRILPLSTDVPTEPTLTATLIQLQATISPIDSAYNPEVAMSDDAVSAHSSLLYLMLILQPMQAHDKGKMKPGEWTYRHSCLCGVRTRMPHISAIALCSDLFVVFLPRRWHVNSAMSPASMGTYYFLDPRDTRSNTNMFECRAGENICVLLHAARASGRRHDCSGSEISCKPFMQRSGYLTPTTRP